MKMEQREKMSQNNHTRLSVKEHTERVRFDPFLVEKKIENNNFKLIYPRGPEGGENQDIYDKILKKATTMWKEATGTNTIKLVPYAEKEKVIKKAKKKKKKTVKEKEYNDYASDEKDEDGEKEENTAYNDSLC
jgi:hypothetical protein